MKRKYHLAFDLGAESGRAVVGCLENGTIKMHELYRFNTGTINLGGHVYCSAINCYQNILTALEKYRAEFGTELESLGVDSWGCDYGLLDRENRLLALPYSYRDARVNGTEKIIEEKMGADRLYRLTGIQMLPINTLNQLIGAVREKDPTIALAENMLFIGDLMHFFLTGRIATEYTMLSISQLIDTTKKQYADEVFECFGINPDIKTEIIQAGDLYGMLRQDICEKVGINSVKVITPAVHDTASGFAAIPAQPEETWYGLSSGTWSILGTEEDRTLITEDTCRFSLSNSGGVMGRNLLLKNVMGLWIVQQCKKEWNKEQPHLDYDDIVRMAMDAEPFYAMIDPDDLIFFNPDSMLESIRVYLEKTNQRSAKGVGQIARIIYESLAFKYRYVIERISKATAKKAEKLYFIGGGNKNEMLNQFSANATGITGVTGSSEACTLGNLLTQCYGCGMISSLEEMRSIAQKIPGKRYDPVEKEKWDIKYRCFLEVTGLNE